MAGRRISFPKALAVVLGVGLPALALIPAGISLLDRPDPLFLLARSSDLVVLAEVMETARIPMVAGRPPRVARLRVREVWKGSTGPEIDVGFDPFVVWPEPPRYVPGEVIVTFLSRRGGIWITASGTSSSTLAAGSAEAARLRSRIRKAAAA
ncbi:MAG TPA: hypothetical protein VFV36_11575 [Candidatus Methylomirabilis sp.]|nr:hypothetical protein [Candidatus Methylomirabilis sp.]